jgi:Phosphatidylinositol-specific phospholipase C, Y domain
LRFSSSNQEPAVFWRTGAQLVALNWQKFDLGMMENEALFAGSGGMVLKPEYIHGGKQAVVKLSIEVCFFVMVLI